MPKDFNKDSSSRARYLPVWRPDILIAALESETECKIKITSILHKIKHEAAKFAVLKVLHRDTKE